MTLWYPSITLFHIRYLTRKDHGYVIYVRYMYTCMNKSLSHALSMLPVMLQSADRTLLFGAASVEKFGDAQCTLHRRVTADCVAYALRIHSYTQTHRALVPTIGAELPAWLLDPDFLLESWKY